ncbi:MAG: hypothetical protein IKS61_01715 [Aeriscardovia sp.]|nr:hypothetical protein [Aeriscardovia sp.]
MHKNDESQEGDDSHKEPEGSPDCQENQEQPKSSDVEKKELVPAADENTPKEKAETKATNGNSSPTSNGSASEAVKVQPPKGRLAGSYLAVAIVISVLALIGLGCGIARTVITSHASTPSSQIGSSTDSSTNSSQPSSTSSSSSAQNSPSSTASSSASSSQASQNNAGSSSTITTAYSSFNATSNICDPSGDTSNNSDSPTFTPLLAAGFNVSGTAHWGSVLSCVAFNTFMPSTVETQLKSLVDQAAVDYSNGSANSPNGQAMSWIFSDKSKIYAYYAPGQGNNAWSVTFNTKPETSQSSGSSIPVFPATQVSDALTTLQNTYTQCSAVGGDSNSMQVSTTTSSDALSLAGSSNWGPVLTCLAQHSDMPNTIQTNIQSAINNYASTDESSDPNPTTLSWSMKDGTKLYASYSGGEQQGEWLFVIGTSVPPTGWNVG